ncbi:DUF6644 family protein [Methylosinus sp. LW4]|uniref:DUF6644 family protein n=1 Tax=Methylosinus sp. LW4 TaxID=136993 RepID=UPI0004756640|nr:DUF6644 family protein [Methylosinus sp. LW4]
MSTLYDLAQALYDSDFGTALRESQYAFPFVEGIHLLGLSFSVGLLAIVDLRLAGILLRDVPGLYLLRQLRPFIVGGFIATFATGVLLFWAMSIKLLSNPALPVKFVFILLAGINFLWFERRLAPSAGDWAERAILPTKVRIAGWTSLVLWSVVVMAGRLIPYLG